MPWLDRCTDRTPPDFRQWGPCAGITIDEINVDSLNISGDIQTEHTFACAFNPDGDMQGWVSSILEDALGDTGSVATVTRTLGFRDLVGAFAPNWSLPVGWSLGECAGSGAGKELVLSVARLCSNMPGPATIAALDGPDPTPGPTVTIPGGYRALSWNYLRETQQDPGDGSISQVIVGNQMYAPGSGYQYQQHGWEVHSDSHDAYRDPITFTVSGEAFIEILVVREV